MINPPLSYCNPSFPANPPRDYCFSFNAMESEGSVYGEGSAYDFGARMYDGRLGRWWSVDPLENYYPELSSYSFVANTPLSAVDPDGRLILFVNGLRLWYGWKDQMGNRIYKSDVYKYWRTQHGETNSFGREVDLIDYYSEKYSDNKTLFTSGSDAWTSQADDRWSVGYRKAEEFHKMVQSKEIILEAGETIKIISHSQGGAHAAGFALGLQQYVDDRGAPLYNIEVIEYITPHQPADIIHPLGIKGIQYSHPNDAVSGNEAPWWLTNGGSYHSKIPGIQTENFFEGNIIGEKGQPIATGITGLWLPTAGFGHWIEANRNGHNATDNDEFIKQSENKE